MAPSLRFLSAAPAHILLCGAQKTAAQAFTFDRTGDWHHYAVPVCPPSRREIYEGLDSMSAIVGGIIQTGRQTGKGT